MSKLNVGNNRQATAREYVEYMRISKEPPCYTGDCGDTVFITNDGACSIDVGELKPADAIRLAKWILEVYRDWPFDEKEKKQRKVT